MNNENIPNEQNFYSLALPSWDKWSKIKHARLWEAVALACNLTREASQFITAHK